MIKKQRTSKTSAAKISIDAERVDGSKTKAAFYTVLLVVIILTGLALMISQKFKTKSPPVANNAQNAQVQNQDQQAKPADTTDVASLIARVSSLIVTKDGEEPTVATVQNADMLRQGKQEISEFYKDVQNGDRLLVWSDKAILYSTKLDKLLAVLPSPSLLLSGNSTSTPSVVEPASATSTPSTPAVSTADVKTENAAVEVRNGTNVAGLARTMSNLLKTKDIRVTLVGDAKNRNYATTVIYKLSDKDLPATLAALSAATKTEVKQPAAGEISGFNGDFVVIVGQDFAAQ
ncbi:MAG: LytR C-terminal domain-containing protein [Patescibacteria group bacterium]|nr:LytR C-terminal domain-containing protein [Patescibacteria group bacterium]